MKSTFYAFDSVRKALAASQAGLDVTGQNVSNVNTEGYSRQRIDLSSVPSETGAYKYAQPAASNIGRGVTVRGITRMRDQFLDSRYLRENSEYNSYDTSLSALRDIENVFDETDTEGLHTRLNDFFEKLQDLSNNPDSLEFANIARSTAQKVAEALNQYYGKLEQIKEQRIAELNIVVSDANNIVSKINELNIEIRNQKLQGEPSNELMDSRGSLIDKLSGYMNISVENQADGAISIKTGGAFLLDASINTAVAITADTSGIPVTSNFNITKGAISGGMHVLNGAGIFAAAGGDDFRGIPYYKESIDSFARTLADTFNGLNAYDGTDKPLFEGKNGVTDAGTIRISAAWLGDAGYITTTSAVPAAAGKNDNVMRMIGAMERDTQITPAFKGTYEEFATSMMSDIAVDVGFARDMARNSSLVLESIEDQRQSVMGVSLDEEAINMIRYQKSYSAAARLMTTLDETLDVLINRMGIVGR